MTPAWISSHQFQKETLLRICLGRPLTPFHFFLVIGRGTTIWVTMLMLHLAIHILSLQREVRSTLNYNLSLHPLIITPLLQQREYKLCIHWWGISVREARTRSVRWNIWVQCMFTGRISQQGTLCKILSNQSCYDFFFLTQVSIFRDSLSITKNQLTWLDWIHVNGVRKQ